MNQVSADNLFRAFGFDKSETEESYRFSKEGTSIFFEKNFGYVFIENTKARIFSPIIEPETILAMAKLVLENGEKWLKKEE